mmetsp:Transcript_39641/g.55217  ORF Transcript_39641/g.55217 Transcript_39641/m.55217 type:complete len:205 (-) Transcript_39641:22-636(-)
MPTLEPVLEYLFGPAPGHEYDDDGQTCPACIDFCAAETDRFERELGVVPWGSAFSRQREATRGRLREVERCRRYCQQYLTLCKTQNVERNELQNSKNEEKTSLETTSECASSYRLWKNYLFVLRNRPTTMEIYAPTNLSPNMRGRDALPNQKPTQEQQPRPDFAKSLAELKQKHFRAIGENDTSPITLADQHATIPIEARDLTK